MFSNNVRTQLFPVITLTGATTLTAEQSGTTVVCSTTSGTAGYNVILPAMSAGNWSFRIVSNIAWTVTALTIAAAAADVDKIIGTVFSSTGGNADSEVTLGADNVTFAASAAVIGDSCLIFTDGTSIFCHAWCNADTGITFEDV